MKANFSLIILLLTLAVTSCKKSDIESERNFKKSYNVWLNFKAETGNSYRYTIVSSSWVGTNSETTVTVKNGKVFSRSFVSTAYENYKNQIEIKEQWEEDEQNINTHESHGRALTLDEIYDLAKTQWLVKQKGVSTTFEVNNNGMISSCGYVPNNCADDCFFGITIKSIEKL